MERAFQACKSDLERSHVQHNLRLRIHHVQANKGSPNPRDNPRFNARRHFLALPPLRVCKKSVSLKRQASSREFVASGDRWW